MNIKFNTFMVWVVVIAYVLLSAFVILPWMGNNIQIHNDKGEYILSLSVTLILFIYTMVTLLFALIPLNIKSTSDSIPDMFHMHKRCEYRAGDFKYIYVKILPYIWIETEYMLSNEGWIRFQELKDEYKSKHEESYKI